MMTIEVFTRPAPANPAALAERLLDELIVEESSHFLRGSRLANGLISG